jgi:hypothetical protein
MVIRRSVIIPLPAELPGSVALRSRRLTAHILRLCNLRPSFVHIPTDGDQRRFFANLPGSVSRLESSPVSRASSSTSTYRRTAYTTPARPPPPFTVTRSGNTTGASSVKVKTSGDTATAGRHQRPGPHHRPSGPGTPPRPLPATPKSRRTRRSTWCCPPRWGDGLRHLRHGDHRQRRVKATPGHVDY